MKETFWNKLPKPFFTLAPMADVTDTAFRRLIAKYGKLARTDGWRGGPDVMWTEFVSADGLCHPVAREKLLIDLQYTEAERPIVAQLFTSNPKNMAEASNLCAELGFDGIDINMGCPDKSIEKQGAGACMIKNPESARAVISAAKTAGLPVSVKTRIGYNRNEIQEWIPILLSENLSALTVHLRTRKEMSKVPAHWNLMPEIVALRDKLAPETLIIGNGDVVDIDDARRKCSETGCDGVMLGKAIFGKPWLFADREDPGVEEKLKIMIEHTKLFEELLGKVKSFSIMKKHYKAYVEGFPGAKELRMKLMEANTASEVEKIIQEFPK